ncbi:GntR family transcriptional regulator [Variovorax sp. J22R133]|uniref:GntR family transcriptional regulator n=1 Tax=Variovorax brevis TaxID=3053503 RepID=UPI002578E1D1|nr:GntR family transcriptional regulator [Variovorax sp. J22R133]MDM0115459.1 GntR family transcriptional regulator [Variovorax sp. J22R133]
MNQPQATEDITVDTIVESVRGSIIRGELPPGSIVNSVDIANRFGTSRTPVREALLILNQYGLVTLTARRRPQVTPVSAQAIRDLYALRAALHAYISDAIVANAPDEALRALRAHAAALAADRSDQGSEEYMVLIEAYLAEEARLCGNALVIEVLDSLKWKISWFRRIGKMSEAQVKSLAADRLRVADAYLDRDARLANALNRSMLQRGGDYCEQNFLATHPATDLQPAGK